MRKYLTLFATFLLALSILSAFFAWQYYKKFVDAPLVPAEKTIDYVLKPGSSIRSLANDLHAMGLLPHPNFLIALAYLRGVSKNLQAGEYIFAGGTTPNQMLSQIAAGKVAYHHFTLVEGWNFSQLFKALNNNEYISHRLKDAEIATALSKLELPLNHPEGMFLPATYRFMKGTSDVAMLRKAHQLMSEFLNKEWQQRAVNLPYKNLYEALIAASLVEKETGQERERSMVSGVIAKRLAINMPLQIDSTVIYGLGRTYTGKLNREDLKKDTPYNTYLHRGLPPTPIAMPSRQSIHATLHPLNNGSLYFVAKNGNAHAFSATLAEQNKAVKTYQVNMHYPKIGKRLNHKKCVYLWYLSSNLQNLINDHC